MAPTPAPRATTAIFSRQVIATRDHGDDPTDETPVNGSPFYAGSGDPAKGGGADGQHIPKAAEIGTIVGVVCLVLIGISALFFMRSHRKKNNRDMETGGDASGEPAPNADSIAAGPGRKEIDDDGATRSSQGGAAPQSQGQEGDHQLRHERNDHRDQSPGAGSRLLSWGNMNKLHTRLLTHASLLRPASHLSHIPCLTLLARATILPTLRHGEVTVQKQKEKVRSSNTV